MKPVNEHPPESRRSDAGQGYLVCVRDWAERHLLLLAAGILLFSAVPFLSVIDDPPHSDVHIYHTAAKEILGGAVPYKDFLLEYPPYAIPLFVLPAVFGDENYGMCFKLLALLADVAIKCLLLVIGFREAKGLRSLLPLALYCIALPFIKYFFLQRYDVFPALISLVGLWLFCSNRYVLAGVMIAVGAGMKVYPALFAPPLLVLAWRERHAGEFVIGLAGGLAPLVLLGFLVPWWNFLAFHSERGLQAESFYASIIWLLHHFGIGDGVWEGGRRCFEVHGALAEKILPWTRLWLILAVGVSTVLTCGAALRSNSQAGARSRISSIARLLLMPLLAFVVFNQVFSPQFMIWLLPLAATASICAKPRIGLLISLAAVLTPGFYPSPEYHASGLDVVQTATLVLRNCLLVLAWGMLACEWLNGPVQYD